MKRRPYLEWLEEKVGCVEVETASRYITSSRSFAMKGSREIKWYMEGNIRSKKTFFGGIVVFLLIKTVTE